MNIQELQTLKTTKLNVIIIVLNNAGYLSIWQTHENFFGKVENPLDACSRDNLLIQNNVSNIKTIDMGDDNNYNPGF